jgi:glycosyltransferase involved in cell wall biosynthesis
VVSVIIPTYNNEDYILNTLSSVFTQTYGEYEIIVIDDGSTDSTREILKPYNYRIRYHYQENKGLAVARNVGLEMASGEYVTFLDGDDIWEPDNLLLKTEVLSNKPDLGGVFSEFLVFNEDGVLHERGSRPTFPYFKRTKKDFKNIFANTETISANASRQLTFYSGWIFDELFMGNFILPTSMVLRKECADRVGRFLSHLRTQQDYEYWLRFSKKYPFGYIDEVLVRYRRHKHQLTNFTNIKNIIKNVLEIIDRQAPEFESKEKNKIFKRRKAEILKDLAKVNIRLRDLRSARSLLLESMVLNPAIIQNYLYYCLTYFPGNIMHQGVEVYRNIRAYTDGVKR